MRSPLKLWNTNKRHHIAIGGLARLEKLPEKPAEELIVALAGPVNVFLAIITGFFITFQKMQRCAAQLSSGVSDNFFLHFFIVNIVLAVFNLIPAFPMDGGVSLEHYYPLN
jgi:Zn-dependent protease